MAGSIGLSLQQQFDITNGRLLSGGKLYTFSAGTTTPQLVYKDQALTLPHPNPITLSSDARIPQLYVADGSIRARLLSRAGTIQFDQDNILVVGPSSGGGGGSSVDATTIFTTGDVLWLDVSGSRSGWVRDNGRTIGSATSGSSERANSDCQLLFLYLWAAFSDTICPVSTGRGLTAAADWAANKTITLPDKRGRGPFGLDDMGNSAAGRLTLANLGVDPTVAGNVFGEEKHALTTAEFPSHTHAVGGSSVARAGGGTVVSAGSAVTVYGDLGAATITIANTGGGTTHNNTSPGVVGTFYRKL